MRFDLTSIIPLTAFTACIVGGLAVNNAAAEPVEHCESPASESVIPSDTIKVVSFNIAHGRKTAMNQLLVSRENTISNIDEVANFLDTTNADVVALQEADGPSAWSGKFDHISHLLDASDFSCAIHGLHASNRLYQFGTALMARRRLDDLQSLRFEPSPPTTNKGLVSAEISLTVDGDTLPITVVSVHLDFSRQKVRDAQTAEMVKYLSAINTPLIIMGDFNSEWSDEDSQVRVLAETLGLNSFEPENGSLGSYKETTGKRLDWILISPSLDFVVYRVLPDMLSDHLAIYSEINYRGTL